MSGDGKGRRRGEEHYPPTFKAGEFYAGMPSKGPLPLSAPRSDDRRHPRQPSAGPAGRSSFLNIPEGATVSKAMGGGGEAHEAGNHFTLVNGMPLQRGHGGRAPTAGMDVTASHFNKGTMMLQSGLKGEHGIKNKFTYAGDDAADHFKNGPGLIVRTDQGLHNQISGKVTGAKHQEREYQHAGMDAGGHFKVGAGLLLRTDDGIYVRDAWEEGDGHRVKPTSTHKRREGGGRKTFPNGEGALQDHFKDGPGAMLRTEVGESAARAVEQPDRRPGSSRASATSPRVMDSSARGSHFKGGAMMLQTGAGVEQFLRVR